MIVLILGMEIRVEVLVEVALILAQEGIWVQMGVNRMDELATPLLLGMELTALVTLPIWTLVAHVENLLTKIVCAL